MTTRRTWTGCAQFLATVELPFPPSRLRVLVTRLAVWFLATPVGELRARR